MFRIKKMDFIIAVYIFGVVTAELMGAKTFPLATIGDFKLTATVAIFLVPFLFTINDVIIEVYGKERAQSVVQSSLVIIMILFLYSILAVSLPPSERSAGLEPAYDTVFTKAIRISAASLIAFAVSAMLDVLIFASLREKLKNYGLWFRNNASNFTAQLIDTIIFMTIAFYHLNEGIGENVSFLIGLILPYWFLKCAMSVFGTPLVYLGVKWLKDKE